MALIVDPSTGEWLYTEPVSYELKRETRIAMGEILLTEREKLIRDAQMREKKSEENPDRAVQLGLFARR